MTDVLSNESKELSDRIALGNQAIAEAALKGDMGHVKAIAEAVNGLQEIDRKIQSLRKAFRKAISDFDGATRTHTKSKQKKLCITLRWRIGGKNLPDERIDNDKAADALARFISSLAAVYGEELFEKLRRVPSGSSEFVSKNPQRDFVNPKSGENYSFRRVGRTSWYVKTHTSTQQKAVQVDQIRELLAMPQPAIGVAIVEK